VNWIWRSPKRQRRRPEAFFNGLHPFRDCHSKLPVLPRLVLNGCSITRPKIMVRILERVDGFGDNDSGSRSARPSGSCTLTNRLPVPTPTSERGGRGIFQQTGSLSELRSPSFRWNTWDGGST
jgi:hypothetical protein